MCNETMFYLCLQISKQFELEKEWLTIDNYYDAILILLNDYIKNEYDKRNMGLLESVNCYIDENFKKIKYTLINLNVSETKKW